MEPWRDVGPVEELVRDMLGGVRILRPNLSKRFAEYGEEEGDEPAGAEVGALRWSPWGWGFVGRVLLALTMALAAFWSWRSSVVSKLSMLFAHYAYVTMAFSHRLEDLQRR